MVLQVESATILHSLHKDSLNDRGTDLLQFVYMMLSSGVNGPLALSTSVRDPVDEGQTHIVFRGLMFRIQMMCCKVEYCFTLNERLNVTNLVGVGILYSTAINGEA